VNNLYEYSLIEKYRELTPQLYEFIYSKFQYESKSLILKHTEALLKLITLIFLKNFKEFEDITVQRVFMFDGSGGSGKSTIVNLMKRLIEEEQLFSGDLAALTGRFETSFLRNKTLAYFADEDFSGSVTKKSQHKLTQLRRLTGNDAIRYEDKFGDVANFSNKALVIVSTNDKEGFLKHGDYAAMKRRLQLFRINKTIRRKDQRRNIVDDIINKEFLTIAFIALSVCRSVDEIVDDIKSFDTEAEILKEGETEVYDSELDSLTAFLEHCIITDEKDTTFTPIEHLFYYYTQFMVNRKHTKIIVNDLDFYHSEMEKCMERIGYGEESGVVKKMKSYIKG